MKRFKLQSGELIKVDDADAYLLRSKVWRVHVVGGGRKQVVTGHSNGKQLSHVIGGPASGQVVSFANGDQLDFRRENLIVMDRQKFYDDVVSRKCSEAMCRHHAKKEHA